MKMRIWDTHVHHYDDVVLKDPEGWGKKRKEAHWVRLVTQGPQGWASLEGLLNKMDAAGVEKVVLQGWYWEQPETCHEQNQWYRKCVEAHPDRIAAFVSMHGKMKGIKEELNRCLDWGAIGVGEILPAVQTGGWQCDGWEALIQWTTLHKWPILMHVTEPAGHAYPGRIETPFEEILEQLEKNPDQVWILAHWGGGLPFYSMNPRVRKCLRNCFFDTAASSLIYDKRIWSTVADLVGEGRILFGSDFPLKVAPSKQTEPDFIAPIESMKRSSLEGASLEKIAAENLKRLLGDHT